MEESKLSPTFIWDVIIFVVIGIMIGAVAIMYLEYSSAKDFCADSEGEFEFKFPENYYCDTIPLEKYSDGWKFDVEINYTYFLTP